MLDALGKMTDAIQKEMLAGLFLSKEHECNGDGETGAIIAYRVMAA